MFSSLRLETTAFATVLILGLAASLSACQGAVDPDPISVDTAALRNQYPAWPIDSMVALMNELPNGTQLALAIYRDSTPVFLGLERRNDSLITVDNADRVYEAGSISKVFTSAFLAQAVTENRVTLQQPVWSLLSLDSMPETEVTLQQLANHTSGMPRVPSNMMLYAVTHPDNPYKKYGPEKLRAYLSDKLSMDNSPGSKYAYSNLGAGLLGYAMTQVYDQPYETLLQEKIAGPLDMSHTTTDITRVQDRMVGGLKPNGNPAPHWEFTDALVGAGGVLSTARDLITFLAAQLEQEEAYMELMQKRTFTANDNMDLALGWHILHQDNGSAWHWHNGGTGGYRSSMAMDTNRQTAAVVLTNISSGFSAAGQVDQLNFTLLRHLNAPVSE